MTRSNIIICLLGSIVTVATWPAAAADPAGGTITSTNTAKSSQAEASQSGPFDLRLQYVGEAWSNTGGAKTGTSYTNAFDASLGIDAGKLFGLQGAKFYVEGFFVGGKSQDFTYTGAIQAPSPIDPFNANNVGKLYQAYYEQAFGKTDVLIGKYDLQQQFATTRPMDVFGNRAESMPGAFSIAGYGAGLTGASLYPNTSVGLRIKQKLNDEWTVKFGVLDGLSDNPGNRWTTDVRFNSKAGALLVGEVDYTPIARTKILAGVYGYTSEFTSFRLSPFFQRRTITGAVGAYVGAATRVFTIEGSRGIDAFVNTAYADPAISTVHQSISLGLTATGLIPGRASDRFGVAFGAIDVSSPYRNLIRLASKVNLPKSENDYEVTYRAVVNDWLVVQPDFDYIVHPAQSLVAKKEALVFGLHFELSKLFNF